MYKLSSSDREAIRAMAAGQAGDVRGDAIEHRLQAELPIIPGLREARSVEERMAAYEAAIVLQRARFIELHGTPFGCDVIEETPVVQTEVRDRMQTFVRSKVQAA